MILNPANAAVEGAHLYIRSGGIGGDPANRPPVYKVVGIVLAIASGLFIGVSFVVKKVGLLKANEKYNEEAGEGYGYLKNAWWWTGMTLMIVGEICNFVAYAFVDAILVTPLGALSVVVTTILSAIFLKERLSFVGKVGCLNCILGSVVIVVNAPSQSAVATIQQMQPLVISPGFLTYTGVIIVGCIFTAFWAGPRWGKKSMMVYLTICSTIGGLSVVATQGLGAAIVAQAGGTPQFNQWFLYVLLVFVIATLVTEIIFLNKALNLFNAALVTPTYYVFFTSCTIITSAILFRGFKGTPAQIATCVLGFLQICAGVVLLQLSKSAKDVPDAAVFKGDLDQVRTVAEQEEPESEPRADSIRGGAAILRSLSSARQHRQIEEAKRLHDERMEPIREGEQVEWDGLRRRKTVHDPGHPTTLQRSKTVHPPLGMSHFPSDASDTDSDYHPGFFSKFSLRRRGDSTSTAPNRSLPLSSLPPDHSPTTSTDRTTSTHVYGLPSGLRKVSDPDSSKPPAVSIQWAPSVDAPPSSPPTPPPHGTDSGRRQFSFQNVFHRHRSDDGPTYPHDAAAGHPAAASSPVLGKSLLHGERRPGLRGALSFNRKDSSGPGTTEEERLGLVSGDSRTLEEEGVGGRREEGESENLGYSDDEAWEVPGREERKNSEDESEFSEVDEKVEEWEAYRRHTSIPIQTPHTPIPRFYTTRTLLHPPSTIQHLY
ncbi:DUF803-domain-containing protein [Eremomyces bilateralis CBS 781.70]|uniref:DUF803-domain-containing protein n=1 Tax=Eremomyces bilateralis CBS 781.70 TaxID=1392243 RepID=A0A6G1FYH6_9PEZI|nr:DUF803-domain-containing protein [Eremomyces bilateralis CBS 781.70]KAF1810818.1 DUF803-domain-containing protein [Eremomyces bilateralis CBS 781.70]